jgi:hypothetical protein
MIELSDGIFNLPSSGQVGRALLIKARELALSQSGLWLEGL